jgi:hypothetical protein
MVCNVPIHTKAQINRDVDIPRDETKACPLDLRNLEGRLDHPGFPNLRRDIDQLCLGQHLFYPQIEVRGNDVEFQAEPADLAMAMVAQSVGKGCDTIQRNDRS